MRRALAISVVCALSLSGCGGSPGARSSSTAKADLRVDHVLDRRVGTVYIEGSVWHLRILDSKGAVILDRRLLDSKATASLEPGRYRLESEEFPCSGNCGNLDPATDGCSKAFEAEPGATIAATVTLRPTKGCTIEFVPEPAA